MKCHGIIGVTPIFLNKLLNKKNIQKRLQNHFIFLQVFPAPERGAYMPFYYVRKTCKCDKEKIFINEIT